MRLFFGALIAVALLGLYVYAVLFAITAVNCGSSPAGCAGGPTVGNFTDGFATVMTTVGGLVSALVISVLAVTEPGKPPGGPSFAAAIQADPDVSILGIKIQKATLLTLVSGLYALVWLGIGFAAFIVGVMLHPGKIAALTDLGAAWLGLAVASAYSWLGLQPPTQGQEHI